MLTVPVSTIVFKKTEESSSLLMPYIFAIPVSIAVSSGASIAASAIGTGIAPTVPAARVQVDVKPCERIRRLVRL